MGLTCYANAVIQCLRNCDKVQWIFEDGRYNTLFKKGATNEREKKETLTTSFAEVVQMLHKCKLGQSVRPADFWRHLPPCVRNTCFDHFATKAPHDAHEFFIFLLDIIHEATAQEVDMKIMTQPTTLKETHAVQALAVWKKEFSNTYSPFVDLFYGLMHARVECQTCMNGTHRWETFTSLKAVVPLIANANTDPPKLEDMLKEEMKPEMIEGYRCDSCDKNTLAKKTLAIWRMPQTLVIVLKRFKPTGQKIQTRVAPIGLTDFSQYFSDESPEKSKNYELKSIVDHHGGSGGGHYTAQCRHTETSKWVMYDDDGVKEIPEPFFGSSTYMLFFQRMK